MISMKKILTGAAVMLFAALPLSVSASTVADWQFNEDNIKSGSISSGDLVLKDASGNGNDLTMRTSGIAYQNAVSFSDESIDDKGSMYFSGGSVLGRAAFQTIDSAPINANNFASGYTIEILYKMPDDWTTADRWQTILCRLAPSDSSPTIEGAKISASYNISNCKEIQIQPRDKDGDEASDIWSIAMDKAENWYHIAIIGDSNGIRSYVNGCESFRNYSGNTMQGLFADPAGGNFLIGSNMTKYLRGYIQEVRISDTPLEKKDWIVPNPEQFVGEYGDNSPFTETPEDRYNFVFVPDSQNTTKFCGTVMDTAFNWLIENKDFANIEAVVSLGDNVENYWETPQWQQSTKNYSSLAKAGLKTVVPSGNHDTNNGGNYWYYKDQYYGPNTEFAKLVSDYTTEYSPSGTGAVADISAGSFPYKIVYLDMYKFTDAGETGWFNKVLTEYANCPVIVVMHDIQNCSDTSPNATRLSDNGSKLWEIVKNHDNVFLMVGGHSHGYGVLELENVYGNKVYSILADYQFSYNGGNALLKFAEFDEKDGKIRVSTFSPYAATLSAEEKTFFDVNYMTGKGHYDELPIDFKERFANLTAGYTVKGDNIMSNPSFEDENGNFSLTGWLSASTNSTFGSPYSTNHCYAVGKTSLVTDGGAITNAQNTIPDGNWAFGTRWNDGDGGLCSLKRYVPVESGKTYLISYKIKHKTGADGAYILTSLVGSDGASENTANATNPGYIGTEWTTVERIFTATNDTDYVLFNFRWLGGSGNPGQGPYWYFDDFSIREVETHTQAFTLNVTAEKTSDGVIVTFDKNDSSDNVIYIAAGYDSNDTLVSAASSNENSAKLTGTDIKSVKLFCWSSENITKPLTTVKTISIE